MAANLNANFQSLDTRVTAVETEHDPADRLPLHGQVPDDHHGGLRRQPEVPRWPAESSCSISPSST
jgi:hypothetical protein